MPHQGSPDASASGVANNRRTLSVPEVAAMYGVHTSTIYRDIKAGRLKAMRLGAKRGVVRVPVSAIEEYEAASAVTP